MIRRTVFRVISAFVAILIALGGSGAAYAFAAPMKTVATSSDDVAARAVADLQNCLARTPVLNVYFLVDDSGSLYADKSGAEASDPNMVRADILSNSLAQLASLTLSGEGQAPIELNYAMGFFSVQATDAIGWTNVNASNAAEQASALNAKIREDRPSNMRSWTHWDVGIQNAQAQLAEKSQSPGCEALIWFTDGGINIDGNAGRTYQALANLCGQSVNGASPQFGPGPFHEMRQAGVSVFGVLFNTTNIAEEEFQRDFLGPLIESSGSVQGSQVSCGTGAVGLHDTGGELIVATTVDDLAFEFMRLGAYVAGGQPSNSVSPTGTFSIDPGIRTFKIIVASPVDALTLTGPSGVIPLENSGGVTISSSANTTQISYAVADKKDFGKWKLSGADDVAKALILYGGIVINPEQANTITLGDEAELAFDLGTSTPTVVSIEDYEFVFTVGQTNQQGEFVALEEIPSSQLKSGQNKVIVTPLADQASAKIWFVATDIKTSLSGQPLSDVRSFQEIAAIVPGMFPSITPTTMNMSQMLGAVQPSSGEVVVSGPTETDSGQICLPPAGLAPVVKTDAVQRSETWTWTATDESGLPFTSGCMTVARGESKSLTFTALNSISAQSLVQGYVPLVLKSSDGQELPQSIDFSFESDRKIDADKLILITAALIFLGAFLPLLVLYLVNLFTTKVEHGDVSMAKFDGEIELGSDKITVLEGNRGGKSELAKVSVPSDHFKMQRPIADAAAITYPEFGTFKRYIPLTPFRSPWFEIVATTGNLLLTGHTPSPLQARRYRKGARAVFGGQMSRLWFVVVRAEDLLNTSTNTVPAKIVIFAKPGRGGSDWTRSRLLEVAREMRLSRKASTLRETLLASGATPAPIPDADALGTHRALAKNSTFEETVPPPPSPGSGKSTVPPPSSGGAGSVPPPPTSR